jgi:putative PIN family toxin of toxin-antitoxin system
LTEKQSSVVIDTNVLISHALLPNSTSARAAQHALRHFEVLAFDKTLSELEDVLLRSKFDRYTSRVMRSKYIEDYRKSVRFVSSVLPVIACRDPRDDKFLSLAISGHAEILITGDADLLSMHPFRGITILSPADFLSL